MAKTVRCSYCGSDREPSDTYHIRLCGDCDVWCCRKCAGDTKFTKCPKCTKYTLK